MATIPRLTRPTVRSTPEPSTLPAVNPLQQAGAVLQGAAQVTDRFAQELTRLNEVRVNEALADYTNRIQNLRVDPKDGPTAKRGTAAWEAVDPFRDRLTMARSEIEASLGNEDQRLLFAAQAERFTQDADRWVTTYANAETERADDESFAALNRTDTERIATLARSGGDPTDVLREMDRRIALYGDRKGWTPEMAQDARQQAISHARTAQYLAMANTENPDLIARARESFSQESGTMTEQDRQRVERGLDLATKAVQEADLGRVVRREATRILSASTSPTERNEMIADLPLELRKGVRDLVRAEQTAAKEARELEQEESFARLEAAVQRGVPLTNPQLASDLVRVSTSQRQTLERYTMAPTNDNAAWLEFYEMSPADIAAMSESQFRSHWSRLSVAHRDDAERMRREATQETTGPDGVRGYVTPQERIARAMREVAGLSPFAPMTQASEEQQAAAVRFQNAADLALRQLPENKRKDPTEIQKTLDALRLETFRTVQTEFRGPLAVAAGMAPFRTREVTQPLFEFSGEAFSRGVAAGTTTFPLERIADAERQRIRNILTGNGLAGTDRQIEAYYTTETFGGDVNALLTRFRGR